MGHSGKLKQRIVNSSPSNRGNLVTSQDLSPKIRAGHVGQCEGPELNSRNKEGWGRGGEMKGGKEIGEGEKWKK